MILKYPQLLLDIISNIVMTISKNITYKTEIIKYTKFLDDDTKISVRIWYIKNNLHSIIKCPVCKINNSKQRFDKFGNMMACSKKCSMSKIDPETGLTGYQKSALKIKKTMSKIDSDTGLTGYQAHTKKFRKTMSEIDSSSGLTKLEKRSKNSKIGNSKIDPITNLTGYQKMGQTNKSQNLKIDEDTGLTNLELKNIKIKETMLEIDPITGLNGYQKIGATLRETMSKTDPETGLTGYDIQKLTMSKIDPETGLTGYQNSALKSKKTMSKIDPETGLTGYQASSIKTKEILSQTDPETGLTGYQKIGKKVKEINKNKCYDKRILDVPKGYSILTTRDEYQRNNLLTYQHDCGNIRSSYWPYIRCTTCYPYEYSVSIGEKELLLYCESLTSNIESNTRHIINPLELDIYLPDYNLAIEYNGVYWHSSDSVESENRYYHLHKTKECTKLNIQLFHIFENEWQDPQKQKIWKSIISNRLGQSSRIYARKTEIRQVSSKDKSEFLTVNHLQGNCVSSVNLGLYSDGDLVSLMTFSKSRYDKKIQWELLRFCNKLNTSVVGGASRLLKTFTRGYHGDIISYADRRRSNGNLYKRLGFEFSHDSSPNYFYMKYGLLESRIQYQKHKLKDKLEVFDPDMTESENMYNNGYRKIYDCGNQVWKLKT